MRAVLQVRSDAAALASATKAAEDAAGVLTVVQARYLQGLSGPLELIDAESSDAAARIARVQADYAYDLGIVRALVATGRPLVEDLSDTPDAATAHDVRSSLPSVATKERSPTGHGSPE